MLLFGYMYFNQAISAEILPVLSKSAAALKEGVCLESGVAEPLLSTAEDTPLLEWATVA